MPVAPTYPGVYIEEIPSGVRTLTGVSTSIAAFLGYTEKGNINDPVRLSSFADYQRAFGDLSIDSPVSYCVRDFFQNGGKDAYVVRVAQNAASATTTLRNEADDTNVLEITASSAGNWANSLQIDVDYDTLNPASLFNVKITDFEERSGQLVVRNTETFRNLSMSRFDPGFAVERINAESRLASLKRLGETAGDLTGTAKATSTSGDLSSQSIAIGDGQNRMAFMLNYQGPYEITLKPQSAFTPADAAALQEIADDIKAKIGSVAGAVDVRILDTSGLRTLIESDDDTERSSVKILTASSGDVAKVLRLGTTNGGVEKDAAAGFRPQMTGTLASATIPSGLGPDASVELTIRSGAQSSSSLPAITLPLWGNATNRQPPASLIDLAMILTEAFRENAPGHAELAGTTVSLIGSNTLRISPGSGFPDYSFVFADAGSDTAATDLGLDTTTRNVARYTMGASAKTLFQGPGTLGNNGTPPTFAELRGKSSDKTGLYALENVDLFNLLIIPEAIGAGSDLSFVSEAIAYCTRRRSFMILDAPENIQTPAEATSWISRNASSISSRNAAVYYPRLRMPDPRMGGVVRTFAAAGAIAGVYARTDVQRGVWKAPAGTDALIQGASLTYKMTDEENGWLNPLAMNCLRTFPVIGTVAWGARTTRGADVLADEYKYIPVRRLALFLEESLYRGTQWVVFEPNDEPLWSQIRLNLGAFMHTLFSQGAFQGQSPREAYFVKCDSETTTQNDINLGRVNILVGFAPLKPAEFVVLQIQQIAGEIQV